MSLGSSPPLPAPGSQLPHISQGQTQDIPQVSEEGSDTLEPQGQALTNQSGDWGTPGDWLSVATFFRDLGTEGSQDLVLSSHVNICIGMLPTIIPG